MLLERIGQIVTVATLGLSGVAATDPQTTLPKIIITQRMTFSIPFNVPVTGNLPSAPVQIVLLVSRDLGVSWSTYGQVPPEKGHFVFLADSDGEYWFNIQSRDRAGNRWPRLTGTPGLRVRVDTTPPKVQISAWRGEGGEVTARWRVEDANFRPEDAAISYRAIGADQWQKVALGSQHQSKSGETHLGEVTWWPQREARAIEVRVEATDEASNRSVATTSVETVGDPTPLDPSSEASTPDGNSPEQAQADKSYGQPWPAEPHPPLARQYQPESFTTGREPPFLPPPPEQVRPVNSRLFELEFDVDSVDFSAISHVELWGTRDGGHTWRSISLHQNGHSPILAKADDEGLYGFRVVVHSRIGLSRTPQPGDSPDIWIRVDLTKPVARIISSEEGTGSEADHLVIMWTAKDEELAEKPVSLAYSPQIGGPWTSIANRLPNTGRYAWPLPLGKLGPIYLRLEVRDAAGNVGEFETKQPVVLNRAPPKVHIREVRPLGNSSNRSAPKRYIFR